MLSFSDVVRASFISDVPFTDPKTNKSTLGRFVLFKKNSNQTMASACEKHLAPVMDGTYAEYEIVGYPLGNRYCEFDC
jgi:hypothetical protein